MFNGAKKIKAEKDENNIALTKRAKKHKKKWLKIAMPAAVAIAVLAVIFNPNKNADAKTPVYTAAASIGDIDTFLNVSGKVTAEEQVTFFAPANVKIESVEAQKGDIVKKGDILLRFDEEAVEYAKKKSELEGKISSEDYNSNMKYASEQKAKLEQAQADIAYYEAAVDTQEKYIDDLTNGIKDEAALKKSDLYAKIYSVEKEMNAYELAIQMPTDNTDMEALMRKKTEKQNELNKLNQQLNMLSDYKTEYGWEDMLTQAKKDLEDYKERLSEAKSKKSSAETALESGNKLNGYQLNKKKSELENADAQKKYTAALNGITADFNGVISETSAVVGATVQENAKLIALQSVDNVCVEFHASKYALETLAIGQTADITISGKPYTGKVSKINHVADQDASGTATVAVRAHIDNPDENIFLGIDAKLKILTASEKGVLQVPVEAVNVDSRGEFCYLIENDALVKKYVEIGISSEKYVQILSGLLDSQEIVTSSVAGVGLDEGMAVTVASNEGMTETKTQNETQAQGETQGNTEAEMAND